MVVNFLALSGSLRAASINSMVLRAAARVAPRDINVSIFTGLGELPLFNPDLQEHLPASVLTFHCAVAHADALLIASPEYAHGMSGTIKNALDWLVGFEPFACKFVAVLNTSSRAHHADDALRETLKTMAAVIVEPASICVPLLGTGLDEPGIIATPAIADAVRACLRALQHAVAARHEPLAAEFPVR